MNIDALKNLNTPAPTGWTPGVQWDGEQGFVTTQPGTDPDEPRDERWDEVLQRFGLDPERYMVDGPQVDHVRTRTGNTVNMVRQLDRCDRQSGCPHLR